MVGRDGAKPQIVGSEAGATSKFKRGQPALADLHKAGDGYRSDDGRTMGGRYIALIYIYYTFWIDRPSPFPNNYSHSIRSFLLSDSYFYPACPIQTMLLVTPKAQAILVLLITVLVHH